MPWNVRDLDVVADHDGWSINDLRSLGWLDVRVGRNAGDEAILQALKDAGYVRESVKLGSAAGNAYFDEVGSEGPILLMGVGNTSIFTVERREFSWDVEWQAVGGDEWVTYASYDNSADAETELALILNREYPVGYHESSDEDATATQVQVGHEIVDVAMWRVQRHEMWVHVTEGAFDGYFYDRGEAAAFLEERGLVLEEDIPEGEWPEDVRVGRIVEGHTDWPELQIEWYDPWWMTQNLPGAAEFLVEMQRQARAWQGQYADEVDLVHRSLVWAYPDDDALLEDVLGTESWRDRGDEATRFQYLMQQTVRAIKAWIAAGEPDGRA